MKIGSRCCCCFHGAYSWHDCGCLVKGCGNIEHILIFESDGKDSVLFHEIIELVDRRSETGFLRFERKPVLSFPGLEIDAVRRKVYSGGMEIDLTAKEYALLYILAVNEGCVLTYGQIYQKVWGEDAFGDINNSIKCHIRNLREKLRSANPDAPFSIRCVREVGYCFEVTIEEKTTT